MDIKRELKNKNKTKKRLLIGIAIILAALALLTCASFIIDVINNKLANRNTDIDYDFYPADFDENIFENAEYVELFNASPISYKHGSITLGITPEDARTHGADVEFMVDLVYDIIGGDSTGYNARFSDLYYKNHQPKQSFTMQMLYEVNIEKLSEESITEDGNTYNQYVFSLVYKIYHNNGTFRRDIGEGSKMQYITVTDASGKLLIDKVSTVNTTIK